MQDKYKKMVTVNMPFYNQSMYFGDGNRDKYIYIKTRIRSTTNKPIFIAYVTHFLSRFWVLWDDGLSYNLDISFKNEKDEIYSISDSVNQNFVIGNIKFIKYYNQKEWEVFENKHVCHDSCVLTSDTPRFYFDEYNPNMNDKYFPNVAYVKLYSSRANPILFEDVKNERFATDITIQWKINLYFYLGGGATLNIPANESFASDDFVKICLYSLDPNNIEVSTPTYSYSPVI